MAEEVNIIIEDSAEAVNISVANGVGVFKHSELTLDDGTNPHATTKTDIGLSNILNVDLTPAVDLNTAKVTFPEAPADGKQYARIDSSWSEVAGGGSVDSVNSLTGVVVLDTDNIAEGTNKYYSDSLVNANTNVLANTSKISYTDASAVSLNTAKVGITPTQATIVANTSGVNTGDQDLSVYQLTSAKGSSNGYASLGSDSLVPSSQLPSYVDDVLEFANLASFPVTGEAGKIYVALDTNKTYRWSGSSYIYITSGAVDSVNSQTGVVSLDTGDISENGNLYYTEARVSANTSVAANTSKVSYTDAAQVSTNTTTSNNALPKSGGTMTGNIATAGISSVTSGTGNFVAGANAGDSIVPGGSYNTLIGDEAGTTLTMGGYNTAVGRSALTSSTFGYFNVALGYGSLSLSTAGSNTAIGSMACSNTNTGSGNVATGYYSLGGNLSGSNNTAVGANSGDNITTGDRNIIIGSSIAAASATADDQLNIGDWITGVSGAITIPNTLDVTGAITTDSTVDGRDIATDGAQLDSNVTAIALNTAKISYAVNPFTSLTDAANISWDSTNDNAKVTLAGNRTLDNPTNLISGHTYNLIVTQDATGSRTLNYGNIFKWSEGTAPILSTGANAVDIFTFIYDGTNLYGSVIKNFS